MVARAPTPGADYRRDLKLLNDKSAPAGREPPALAELTVWQTLEVERMAMIGLNLETIAMRLGFDFDVWLAMIKANPAIDKAYRSGAAIGQDRAATGLFKNVQGGDIAAQKYYLDRFGGPQFRPAQQGPAVVVQTGPLIQLDTEGMRLRFERQRQLADGTSPDLVIDATAESDEPAQA